MTSTTLWVRDTCLPPKCSQLVIASRRDPEDLGSPLVKKPCSQWDLQTARDLQSLKLKLSPQVMNAVPVHVETSFCRRLGTHKVSCALVRRPKGSPPRDNADGKHRVPKPTAKTRPTRKHYPQEGSENSPFTHGRSNNKIHFLPKTKCGGSSINNDQKGGTCGQRAFSLLSPQWRTHRPLSVSMHSSLSPSP